MRTLLSDSSEFQSCYGRLMDTLRQLPDDQLELFATRYLAPSLVAKESLEAKSIVDALQALAISRQKAQDLLVKYVFRASTVDKELIMSALHVCFTVKVPSQVRKANHGYCELI